MSSTLRSQTTDTVGQRGVKTVSRGVRYIDIDAPKHAKTVDCGEFTTKSGNGSPDVQIFRRCPKCQGYKKTNQKKPKNQESKGDKEKDNQTGITRVE